MARRTLAELKTAADPWRRDFTNDEFKVIANLILMELDKDFGRKIRRTFTTTEPDTSPTVDINQGETSATVASGTFPTTYDGQLIQIEGSDAWYEISDTVANTSFSISSGFEGADITGAEVTVAFHRIVLDSDLIHVEDISRPGKKPLGRITDELPILGAANLKTAEPSSYYEVEPLNTDDDQEIILVNPPDDVYTYIVTGRTRITRFDGTSSKCGLPEKFENVLFTGILWAAVSQSVGVEEAAFWWQWYQRLKSMALAGQVPQYAGGAQSLAHSDDLRFYHPDNITDNT